MARLGKCSKCGTKKWKKNHLGFYICKYGHQLENYQEEQAEVELAWAGTHRRRNLKRKREKESKEYHGAKGQFLLFQAFQYILRQQVYVLINEFGLPAELEEIVQELWLLYVSSTNLTYNEELVDASQFSNTTQSQSNPADPSSSKDEVDLEFGDLEFSDLLPPDSSHSDKLQKNSDDAHVTFNLATSDSDTDDAEDAENAVPPSAYDDETSGADSEAGGFDSLGFPTPRKIVRDPRPLTNYDPRSRCMLQFTIVICYLGCVWCRVPVLLADLRRWAAKGKLPYSSAYLNLPDEMREHIFDGSRRRLDTNVIPECPMLHSWTYRFVRLYRQDYGIEFPRLNGPLVIYRHIRELVLPVELYTAAINLSTLLDDQLSKAEKALVGRGPLAAQGPSSRPCVNFMAIVLVVAKLCYTLNDQKLHPVERDGIVKNYSISNVWLKGIDKKCADWERSNFPASDRDIESFANANPSAFLKYCEESLVIPNEMLQDRRRIPNFFPIYPPSTDNSSADNSWTPNLAFARAPQRLDRSQFFDWLMMGSHYVVYEAASDDLTDYHAQYAEVLTHAAQVVGVKLSQMQKVVMWVEREIQKKEWWKGEEEKVKKGKEKVKKGKEKKGKGKKGKIDKVEEENRDEVEEENRDNMEEESRDKVEEEESRDEDGDVEMEMAE